LRKLRWNYLVELVRAQASSSRFDIELQKPE
jgi:hypothetical protein